MGLRSSPNSYICSFRPQFPWLMRRMLGCPSIGSSIPLFGVFSYNQSMYCEASVNPMYCFRLHTPVASIVLLNETTPFRYHRFWNWKNIPPPLSPLHTPVPVEAKCNQKWVSMGSAHTHPGDIPFLYPAQNALEYSNLPKNARSLAKHVSESTTGMSASFRTAPSRFSSESPHPTTVPDWSWTLGKTNPCNHWKWWEFPPAGWRCRSRTWSAESPRALSFRSR